MREVLLCFWSQWYSSTLKIFIRLRFCSSRGSLHLLPYVEWPYFSFSCRNNPEAPNRWIYKEKFCYGAIPYGSPTPSVWKPGASKPAYCNEELIGAEGKVHIPPPPHCLQTHTHVCCDGCGRASDRWYSFLVLYVTSWSSGQSESSWFFFFKFLCYLAL